MGQIFEQTHKENTHMANNYTQHYHFRETQIKTTMRQYLIIPKTALIKKTESVIRNDNDNHGKVRTLMPCCWASKRRTAL